MKKLFLVLVLVVLVVLGFLFWSKGGAVPSPVQFLDRNTLLYAELPDLERSLGRWRATALAAMAGDPGIAPFLERPGRRLWDDANFSTAAGILRDLKLRQLFLAVGSPESGSGMERLPFLIGFRSSAGTQGHRQILDRLHEEVAKQTGGGEVVLEEGPAGAVFRQSVGGAELCTVVSGAWGLVSNDAGMVQNFLRAMRQPQAEGSLAAHSTFVETRAQLGAHPDFLFYASMPGWVELLKQEGMAQGAVPDPVQFEFLEKLRAVGFSSTLEGKNSVERKVILAADWPSLALLENRALSMAPSSTLLYLASRFDASALTPEMLQEAFGPWLGTLWGEGGEGWNELPGCLGREASLFLWWPATSLLPGVVGMVELSESAKAERIVGGLLGSMAGESLVVEEGGWRIHSLPNAGFGLLSPVLAFGEGEVLATLNMTDLGMVTRTKSSGENFAQSELVRSLSPLPEVQQLGILDLGGLVERAYLTLQPMLGFAAAMSPQVGEVVDLEKLPPAEAVVKHLGPVVATQKSINEGAVTEIRGPLLFSHLLVGAAVGAAEGFENLPGRPGREKP